MKHFRYSILPLNDRSASEYALLPSLFNFYFLQTVAMIVVNLCLALLALRFYFQAWFVVLVRYGLMFLNRFSLFIQRNRRKMQRYLQKILRITIQKIENVYKSMKLNIEILFTKKVVKIIRTFLVICFLAFYVFHCHFWGEGW